MMKEKWTKEAGGKRQKYLKILQRPNGKVSVLREKRPGINVIERKQKMNGVSTDMVLTENRNYRQTNFSALPQKHPFFAYAKVLLGHVAKAHFSHTCSQVNGGSEEGFRFSRFAK